MRGINEKQFDLDLIEGKSPLDLKGHLFASLRQSGRIMRMDFAAGKGSVLTRGVLTPARIIREAEEGAPFEPFPPKSLGIHSKFGASEIPHNFNIVAKNTLIIGGELGVSWIMDPITLNGVTPIGETLEWVDQKSSANPSWILPFISRSGDNYCESPEHAAFCVSYPLVPNFDQAAVESIVNLTSDTQASSLLSAFKQRHSDLVSWQLDKAKPFKKMKLIKEDGSDFFISCALMHETFTTKDYVFFLEGIGEPAADVPFIEPNNQIHHRPARLGIISRRSLINSEQAIVKTIELPAGCFRLRGVTDSTNNTIQLVTTKTPCYTFDFVRSDDVLVSDPTKDFQNTPVNLLTTPPAPSSLVVITLKQDTSELVSIQEHKMPDWHVVELTPSPDASSKASPHFRSIWVSSNGFRPETYIKRREDLWVSEGNVPHRPLDSTPSTFLRFNLHDGSISDRTVILGNYRLLNLTPVKTKTADYLIAQVYKTDSKPIGLSEVWVYDANSPASGPLCRLGHPQLNDLTTHTVWMDSIKPYDLPYRVDIEEDYQPALSHHTPEVRRYFKEVVFPSMGLDAAQRAALRVKWKNS